MRRREFIAGLGSSAAWPLMRRRAFIKGWQVRPRPAPAHQSGLTPDALTTLAHFSVSTAMKAANSDGV
jgi:hypothetical protein